MARNTDSDLLETSVFLLYVFFKICSNCPIFYNKGYRRHEFVEAYGHFYPFPDALWVIDHTVYNPNKNMVKSAFGIT
jgi:hypothetical protein